jgi:glycosyltransferase involved in cell wall biosynthesis
MLQRVDHQDKTGVAHDGVKLRILIASYRSHPHVGGQGVYVRELSRALAEFGHSVSVASGPPYPDLDPRVELIRIPSLDLFAEQNALKALKPHHLKSWADISEYLAHNTGAFGEIASFGRRLRRFLRAHPGRFDVVHDNQSLASALLRIRRMGTPVVATLHHPITRDLAATLRRSPDWLSRIFLRRWHGFLAMQARTARRLPHILCVSEAARRAAMEDFRLDGASLAVAHNGVDPVVFHPDAAVTREPGLIVSAASADVPLKGLDVLIRAFAQIAQDVPHARLTVIGRLRDGAAKRALTEAGLQSRVEFVSGLSSQDVADLYRRAQLFVSPSFFEGFGFPAAEAMACGAPVVVTDGGALPEVVGDAGRIVPAGDEIALGRAMFALLANPDERARMSAKGVARARDFSWPTHAQAALNLYRHAIMETHAHRRP